MSPKVTRLSATRISTYEQCPKYYDFEYVTRERRAFTPVEWEVGSIVHKALAQLFEQVRDRHRATVPKIGNAAWHKPVVERLAETLRQSVQSGEVRIIRQEVQLEHYLQQIDSAIAKFNTKVLPSLVEHKVAGIEADLGKYTLAGVEIVGRIDLVTMQGANVYVHDWKTGKRRKEDERQAKLYYFGCLAKYSRSLITYRLYHLLEEGDITETYAFPQDAKARLEEELKAFIAQVEGTQALQAKPSVLCYWCPHGSHCPEGSSFMAEHSVPSPEMVLDLGIS
jgi:ATP-dependent exoDNAse (exonuclease V) beta subunit